MTDHDHSAEPLDLATNDIRFALWNACRDSGIGCGRTDIIIDRAMAEPLMQRALAARPVGNMPIAGEVRKTYSDVRGTYADKSATFATPRAVSCGDEARAREVLARHLREANYRDSADKVLAGRGALPNELAIRAMLAFAAPALEQGELRLREALTPSGETKCAYMGEFSFTEWVVDANGIEQGYEHKVPWTTIKEIMRAIRERADADPLDEFDAAVLQDHKQ